jgi:hypothetical protein
MAKIEKFANTELAVRKAGIHYIAGENIKWHNLE